MKLNIKSIIFTFIVLLIITFGVVLGFSSEVSRFECDGQITSKNDTQPATIYIKLEEYRWWVGLWSDSNGNLRLEIPNMVYQYYSHIDDLGELLHIYPSPDEFRGSFSKLSKILAIETSVGFFDGKCKNLER